MDVTSVYKKFWNSRFAENEINTTKVDEMIIQEIQDEFTHP
ncbi:hypothetical protein LC087_03925 [Bacillus carboniphilus]|uniref:Uncharacterized protein n=1 Tax=Bacillus carboniphilus TaxID=86663 RepID=A0ABY9JX34_9BACI|nr:hypothetical protein [Bacillus carboniphilus]WLR43343.1 hypothetical protein LC087_03925 [Bacillus carboniphilus]